MVEYVHWYNVVQHTIRDIVTRDTHTHMRLEESKQIYYCSHAFAALIFYVHDQGVYTHFTRYIHTYIHTCDMHTYTSIHSMIFHNIIHTYR